MMTDDLALYWHDGNVVHLCESSEVHPGIVLVWTLCGKDVPPRGAVVVEPPHRLLVTCPKCVTLKGGA